MKGVILSTPNPGPQNDDAQKGGDTDNNPKEGDTESPQPVHKSDNVEPGNTEKFVEDSGEPDDEEKQDDECQMLDMNFIDPTVPVQGEDSDVVSEDLLPLSRKRKVADTVCSDSHADNPSPSKKPKSIVSISNLAAEWCWISV